MSYAHADRLLPQWGNPDHWNGEAAAVKAMAPELRRAYQQTVPIAGRPGWRRDAAGREWYSDAWLDR